MLRSCLPRIAFWLALGAGCADVPVDPYHVPRAEFAARVHTIAVAPVSAAQRGIGSGKGAAERLVALIVARLQRHGLATVSPAEVAAAQMRIVEAHGGLFDPMTGAPDPAKVDAVRLELLAELGARFHADAVLFPVVTVVSAPFSQARAEWCGTLQEVYARTDNALPWLAASSAANGATGTIPASCLVARIQDVAGATLYENQGGIEVIETFDGTRFTARPPAELFADLDRLEAAVGLALDALPGGAEPARR